MPIKRHKNKVRIAKRKHYCDIFNDSKYDSKLTWNSINDILHKGCKQSNYLDVLEDDKVVDDPQKIANSFNSSPLLILSLP